MNLRKRSETANAIVLEWDPVGDMGYVFYADDRRVSWTNDPNRDFVSFKKGPSKFRVVALSREDEGVWPPAVPPPPPVGNPIPANGVISQGGTYTGSSTGTLRVETSQPVVIDGASLTNLTGGNLISCRPGVGADLTVRRVTAKGGGTYQTSGRFVEAESNVKRLHVVNCSIENTRGIDVSLSDGIDLLITRNRHKNIQGGPDASPVGNFVQLRVFRAGSAEISWNEVVNEYGKSEPEDLLSLYYMSNVKVLDNMFRHHSRIGNLTPSSQGGITIDVSQGPGPQANDNVIARNQLVDGYGIVAYFNGGPGGNNNLIEDNRIVADRLLPNGQQKANGWGHPLVVHAGGQNNHAHGNVVGYIDAGGTQTFCDLSGCPEGHAAEAAKNTRLPAPNAGAEQAEWDRWLAKLAANGISIGA